MSLARRINTYVPMDEVHVISADLAKKIKSSYSPDVVVCIAGGGVMPGIEIARELSIPLSTVTISRVYDVSKAYAILPKPLAELYHMILFFTQDPALVKGVKEPVLRKRVLLLDDVLHTGKTFSIAKKHLEQQAPLEIRTATLSFVGDERPDFFVKKGRFHYPWSKGATETEQYLAYLNQSRITL